MRSDLAEKLLARILDWTPEEISTERPLLQALAVFKYNEYQQYSPGIRFTESLVKWLSQFKDIKERKVAYNYIKENLIFISNDQLMQLVNITYADKIDPIIIEKTAKGIGINRFFVKKIRKSTHFKSILRRSLFIGLSDGSKIDQLRRSYSRISNEQVLSTYYISGDKVQDMLAELKKSGNKKNFNTVFLIDDFTASGTSYFRKKDDKWGGKIYKFIHSVLSVEKEISKLIEPDEVLDIYIIFYVATEDAIERLKGNMDKFRAENPACNFEYKIDAVQILSRDFRGEVVGNKDFVDLITQYYDDEINDSHYKMGKHDFPQLGFNECALPLVLNHNTPNNSLPILWFPEDKRIIGLFPRVTRHKDAE